MTLAQLPEGVDIAKTALEKASSGEILVAVMVLIVGAMLGTLYLWFVVIPDKKAFRESNAKLAEGVAAICPVVANIHALAEETHQRVGVSTKVLRPAIRIFEKISDAHPELKLSGEIGAMKGAFEE